MVATIVLFGRRNAFVFLFAQSIFVLLLFYWLDGCILTSLERHYTKKDETTVDDFIRLCNMPVTRETRIMTSVTTVSVVGVVSLLFAIRIHFTH